VLFTLGAIGACGEGDETAAEGSSGTGAADGGGGDAGNVDGGAAIGGGGSGGSSGTGGASASGGAGGSALCGNDVVDQGEDCDDGNSESGDGCEPDCRFTCIPGPAGNSVCSDFLPCNGAETCLSDHTCAPGTPLNNGTRCGAASVCFNGVCGPPPDICGDGLTNPFEECDDGNLTAGDGCEDNCLKTCVSTDSTRDCNNPCAVGAACDDVTSTCLPGTPVADGTSCGTDLEPLLVCRGGTCTSPLCGNRDLDAGEECDDGNLVGTDGCGNDCTFNCVPTDATRDCTLTDPCQGTSTCNSTTHLCSTPSPLPDGTACGPTTEGRVCFSGVCTLPVCGNRILEPTEQCDDGNLSDTDGCRVDCTYTCTEASACSDARACTQDLCDLGSHTCSNPADVAMNGTLCTEGGVTNGSCQSGVCTPPSCGNAVVEFGESCDPPGVGCTAACQYECSSDASCSDADPCNGAETCITVTGGQTCQSGTPLSTGTACGDNPYRVCSASHRCVTSVCGDQIVDSRRGEACDDGNTSDGDGCKTNCSWTCNASSHCRDDNSCTLDVCSSHVCSNPANTSVNGQTCSTGTCQNGVCTPPTCGNGTLESGEVCDNGSENGVAGGGCTLGCAYQCATAADCSDGNPCNGTETCDTVAGGRTCQTGAPPDEGSVCQTSPLRRICRNQVCLLSTCGDSYTDTGAGEGCDEGAQNGVFGSGCSANCQVAP
jgi:cysteine-rich repeat protein